MDYQELIEKLRGRHECGMNAHGYDLKLHYEAANAIESLLAENERLNHNLTSTEQTMREYQELAAKRLEEIAKYRDAPEMTDRELLELAAKAAGYSVRTDLTYEGVIVINDGVFWNPLTDDGAALRLAVKLGLVVDVGPVSVSVHKNNGNRDLGFEFYNTGKDDPYATTRRAIIRAAAAIGEQMK